jgi:hypothetical protein
VQMARTGRRFLTNRWRGELLHSKDLPHEYGDGLQPTASVAVHDISGDIGGSSNAQLQRSNVIRAFFITNGRRLLTERPAWMSGN